MSIDLTKMIKEAMIISVARRKLKEGIELTTEEKEAVLQKTYASARKSISDVKDLNGTKARVAFGALSLVSRLAGEKGQGLYEASKTMKIGPKNIKDNYKRVLQGVSATSANQIPENFINLLEQYEAADAYEKLFEEFMEAFAEVSNSYKKEFEKPVAPEVVENLEERRDEVVELSTRYIKK